MEVKLYLKILLTKWWIVLPSFIITLTIAIVLTFTQPPVYQSTATFIVSPNPAFGDVKSFANGLDILSRRTEIATTYAEVASSRLIRREAIAELNLTAPQRSGLAVSSKLRAGTNVLEITVVGSNPQVVKLMADKVGEKTMLYAQSLYETFDMRPLDEAFIPSDPIAPQKKLNVALGGVFGLVLGGGLAFLSAYLQTPLPKEVPSFGILDEESGACNKQYFLQRLEQEMTRAKRHDYPLSLALMDIDPLHIMGASLSPQTRVEAMHKVLTFLKQNLREEDIIARWENSIFAFLLLDMTEAEAKALLEKMQARIEWTPFEMETSDVKFTTSSVVGLVGYQYNGTRSEEFVSQASQALSYAEESGAGKIYSFAEIGAVR